MRSINLSTSKVKTFKQCRRKYYLQYIAQVPSTKTEALETGTDYHKAVAKILKKETDYIETPLTYAFKKLQLPEIMHVERLFNVSIGYGINMVGYIDLVFKDGVPCEHKTTKMKVNEEYVYSLNWDDQCTDYLAVLSLLYNKPQTKIIYTAVQKPTIKLKQTETQEEYVKRCFAWYDEEPQYKYATFPVVRTIEDLDARMDELRVIAKELIKLHNDNKEKAFYRNPDACAILGCQYESVCLDRYFCNSIIKEAVI
jgi:hypothetical protein